MTSCSSLSPVGSWDYKVTGTPQGDYGGVLIVRKKDKKTLNAVMRSNGNDLPFNSFTFDPKTKKSNGDFNYQGMSVNFDASVSPAEMNGGISVEGMNFPFKATRKKK
ncbi:MAG TPA: hypothetical protein DGG95_00450 [Cytophagales bacterium]|nr:hypothetical protein [Cytophagales bacterium]